MRSLLALSLAVLVAGAIGLAVSIPQLADTRLEETRTPVPGSSFLDLEGERYNVFYELPSNAAPEDADGDTDIPIPGSLRLRLSAPDGAPVEPENYSGSFTTDSGGRAAQAWVTITPPRAGRYGLTVSGAPPGAPNPTVVLGTPMRGRILAIVLSGIAVVLGLIAAIVFGILAVMRGRRRPPPPAPGTPTAMPSAPPSSGASGTDAFGHPL